MKHRRLLSILLTLTLIVSLAVPMSASAEEDLSPPRNC